MNRNFLKQHLVEGPVTYNFTLHLRMRDHNYMRSAVCWDGLWTLSLGFSHFHGHGSRLVWEVAPKKQNVCVGLVGVGGSKDNIRDYLVAKSIILFWRQICRANDPSFSSLTRERERGGPTTLDSMALLKIMP